MDAMNFQESDTVISRHHLFRPYGKGRIVKIKKGLARVEYIPHIFTRSLYFTHTKLLRLEELEKIPSPVEKLQNLQLEETWRFDLRQMAARLLTANKGGQLSDARAELIPHQVFTAYEVVKSKRRRFLLADQVGPGKTIKVGLIWQTLFRQGAAGRTLIICPAGLMFQWHEEMEEKFGTFFEIFGRDFININPRMWNMKYTAIAPMDALEHPEDKARLFENRKWDLIIVDDAHKLCARGYGTKPDKTGNFKLAKDLKHHTEALLLITATPHQGEDNHSCFIRILDILSENIDFTPLIHKDLPLFRAMADPDKIPYHRCILRTPKMAVTDASGGKVFRTRKVHKCTFDMFPDEKEFYKSVTDYVKKGYSHLERLTDNCRRMAIGSALSIFLKTAASSTSAIKNLLRNRKMFLIDKERIVQERYQYKDERFLGEYEESLASFGFEEQFFKNEIEEIDSLLEIEVQHDVKSVKLVSVINSIFETIEDKEERKIVIFTEYLATQKHIIEILEKEYGNGCVTFINGSLDVDQRRANHRQFRDDGNLFFLVSTESVGEGMDLQFSHILFNYDMPCNPMRIEQRVGRIYRYGQEKVVQIYNFRTRETTEEKIYRYIEEKIERAAKELSRVTDEDVEEIVIAMYGEMENEIDYNEIYKKSLMEGDSKKSEEEIDRGIAKAKRAYELAAETLFKDVCSYSFDIYEKHLKTEFTLQDVESFTKKYLKLNRKKIKESDGIFSFTTPDHLCDKQVKERYENVTFDRKKAIVHPEFEFFAIGHPFIDKMIKLCGSVEFGGYVTGRVIHNKRFSGAKGIQFNYIVRYRIQRDEEQEFLFDMYTVFVDELYQINENLAYICQRYYSENDNAFIDNRVDIDIKKASEIAIDYLRKNIDIISDWEEDIELLNAAIVQIH
jgi:superfamily II DNA or RNA helicase